jgi:hypothetical protein
MSRLVYVVWGGPAVFAFSFLKGYRDSPVPSEGAATAYAVLTFAAGALALVVPMPSVRMWAFVNLALCFACAWAIRDNAVHHSGYSGYGALIVVPLAVITFLSILGTAVYAQVRVLR